MPMEVSVGASRGQEPVAQQRIGTATETAAGGATAFGTTPIAVSSEGLLLPLHADAELEALLGRASWLGGQGRSPLVSFQSLFLALFAGDNPLARWMISTAVELGLTQDRVLEQWRLSSQFPPQFTLEHVLKSESAPIRDFTPSAAQLIQAADGLRRDVGAATLGPRHVIAAYVFAASRGPHADDMARWQFDITAWTARFVVSVGQWAPNEANAWRRINSAHRVLRRSERITYTLGAAHALAETRGASTISVEDVMKALLYLGQRWRDKQAANAWLVNQLTGRTSTDEDSEAVAESYSSAVWSRLGIPDDIPVRKSNDIGSDPAVVAWFHDAEIWALACPYAELNMRHILAALLAGRGPAVGKRMLRQAGAVPLTLAGEFAALIRAHEPNEDHETWDWLLANDVVPQPHCRPGYTSDVARGEDLLAITDDVHALASVIASTETAPPLSVGLFGNWGSGKSFFMAKLRDHIQMLAEQSKQARQSSYCARVAQIELNAWHYVQGDLWTSFVAHILECLDDHLRGNARVRAERSEVARRTKEALRGGFDERQQALNQQREELDEKIRTYVPARAAVVREIAAHAVATAVEIVEKNVDVRAALAQVAERSGVPAAKMTLARARAQTTAIRAWWAQLSPPRILLGAAWIAVAALVAIVAAQPAAQAIASVFSAAPIVLAVERIIRVGRPLASASREAVETGKRVSEALAQETYSQQQASLAAEQDKLDRDREDFDKQLAALTAEAALLKQPSLGQYVLERASHYRDKLGIVANAHRDFRNLSDLLRDAHSDTHLERIVLYVDDLDRCPPDRVVEVLQAIHILLSFELFVVVVAVDPRWLHASLEAYYARQFPSRDANAPDPEARPQAYLEKIFQIPYALRPMTTQRFDRMVSALLQPALEPLVVAEKPDAPASSEPRVAREQTLPDSAPVSSPVQQIGERVLATSTPIDLTPHNLSLTRAELAHLRQLGPLVGSPRAVKRLTNLYRIVRAGLQGDALDAFVADGYQLTQVMLAAVVGCPDLVADWLVEILPREQGDRMAFLAPLSARGVKDPRAGFLHELICVCAELDDWEHVLDVCTSVARYSFETGSLLTLRA